VNKRSELGDRTRQLEWVPVDKMRISPLAQRELNPAWVDRIATEFDPEEFGTPTLNYRNGFWLVIDGQHRVEALRQLGWGDTKVECWVYRDLSEEQEAEKFLVLNHRLQVATFPKFRIGVEAGREEETTINDVVLQCGLHISKDKRDGTVSAVGTLRTIYRRDGAAVLARMLAIVRDAYGTPGLRAEVMNGMGLFCGRYEAVLDDARAVERLSTVHGGVNGLLGRADTMYRRTGNRRNHCVAAAAAAIYNSGKGGGKLSSWWKGGAGE
jgi:hypothetical protein